MGVWGAALQGVLGVDSGIQQGISAGKQLRANLEMANDAADDARRRGGLEAGAARSQGSQMVAKQRVAYSNSGVDATVGTPAEALDDTRARSELNAMQLENNAAREAWGYAKHGIAFQTQAGIDSSRRNRETAGTILGAAGQAASAYSKTGFGI